MIKTKTMAECTEDEKIFYGKIEIETDNAEEYRDIKSKVGFLTEDENGECIVAHCNRLKNAKAIAKILDADILGEIAEPVVEIGDIVYCVIGREVVPMAITGVYLNKKGFRYMANEAIHQLSFRKKDIGKTVFYSLSDARSFLEG